MQKDDIAAAYIRVLYVTRDFDKKVMQLQDLIKDLVQDKGVPPHVLGQHFIDDVAAGSWSGTILRAVLENLGIIDQA